MIIKNQQRPIMFIMFGWLASFRHILNSLSLIVKQQQLRTPDFLSFFGIKTPLKIRPAGNRNDSPFLSSLSNPLARRKT